jgi:hypothetical protein
MKYDEYKITNDYVISVIGAGGIGNNLLSALVPALHRGELLDSTDMVKICIYDSDKVSENNLAHQGFLPKQVGMPKVHACETALGPFLGDKLSIRACNWDVREVGDIEPSDLVVVAVDSSVARRVVHMTGALWLDLRCRGDGYIAMDHTVDPRFVSRRTPDQAPMSCQMDGAIESGNIQFGHLWAAAHGAQWVLQWMRYFTGADNVPLPAPRAASLTLGELAKLPTVEQECIGAPVRPEEHPEEVLHRLVDEGHYDCKEVLQAIAQKAEQEDWKSLWDLADRIGREVSVIIDAEGLIFVDIGSRGEVLPARPVGATVPFRRWIHTHPMDAYWSSTDLDSLSAFSPLITEAMVLGMDQYKRTTTVVEEGTPRLGAHPPLSNWSSEPTRMYQAAGARNE